MSAPYKFNKSLTANNILTKGSTSGTISILPQANSGTYNFNLPTTSGSAGQVLVSGGGSGNPMNWVNQNGGQTFSTTGLQSQVSPVNINGLVYSTSLFNIFISVDIVATTSLKQVFRLSGVNSPSSGWSVTVISESGDDTLVDFSISAGNVQYTSGTYPGFVSLTFTWTDFSTSQGVNLLSLAGSTSGSVTIAPQANAGTFNFNLPVTAGSSGDILTSGGGSSAPMTWTGSTGTGNLVRVNAPTLTGTLNCGPVVSTGVVSGTGYVGNSTGLSASGNIGEIATVASSTALTNAIHYYTWSGTAVTTTWADVVTGPTLTPGLYLCHAQIYVDVQTVPRVLQWNFAMGGVRCFGPWVSSAVNVGYTSGSVTKIIRVTANQVITLQGVITPSSATLADTMNCISITRIG